jgi:hypothetical protein
VHAAAIESLDTLFERVQQAHPDISSVFYHLERPLGEGDPYRLVRNVRSSSDCIAWVELPSGSRKFSVVSPLGTEAASFRIKALGSDTHPNWKLDRSVVYPGDTCKMLPVVDIVPGM